MGRARPARNPVRSGLLSGEAISYDKRAQLGCTGRCETKSDLRPYGRFTDRRQDRSKISLLLSSHQTFHDRLHHRWTHTVAEKFDLISPAALTKP